MVVQEIGVSQESLLDTPVSEALGTAAVAELFDSILHEVRDEVNVPAKHLSDPTLLGFIRNTTSAGRPSAVFHSESACWVHTVRRLCPLRSHRINRIIEHLVQPNMPQTSLDDIAVWQG